MKTQNRLANRGNATQGGFSLVELMFGIALLAILIALAAPSFTRLINANRLTTMTDSFYTALILARNESLTRNAPMILCKSSDGATCVTTGDWQQGWILFEDTDNDGAKHATDEPVLKRYEALQAGYTLTTAGATFSNSLTYRPDGSTNGFDTFRLCDPDADATEGRSITISVVGRPRISKGVAGCS